MTVGRTVWWAKDSAWWRRELTVALGEEFGPVGPAVVDWLSCEAKAQNERGGWVKSGYHSLARGIFSDAVTVCHVVSRAVTLGALDEFSEAGGRFECRLSGWAQDQERGRAAARKADQRDREFPANTDIPQSVPDVTDRDMSRPVTPSHQKSLTGQYRTEEKQPPPAPPKIGGGRERDKIRAREEKRQRLTDLIADALPDSIDRHRALELALNLEFRNGTVDAPTLRAFLLDSPLFAPEDKARLEAAA